MKGFLFLLTIILFNSNAFSQAPYDVIRGLYFMAADDAGITNFYNAANKFEGTNDQLLVAYKATATAMYASVCKGVSDKFQYFNSGKTLLESAVGNAPKNAEIRFLRFSVQSEIPSFLGYKNNLKEDADLIIQQMGANQIPHTTAYWQNAISFMLKSGQLTKTQTSQLQNYQLKK